MANTLILKKTNSNDPDFKSLVALLDRDLDKINGDLMLVYNEHNLLDFIETVVIAYIDGAPAGCGCFKNFNDDTAEVKRMFVTENQRCKGIASAILRALELWAKEIGYTYTILETGKLHLEAIRLYERFGYVVTENYEPYIGMEESVCMRKEIA
jgi:putative acetyltransferase